MYNLLNTRLTSDESLLLSIFSDLIRNGKTNVYPRTRDKAEEEEEASKKKKQ
jgi:hypothetical protein